MNDWLQNNTTNFTFFVPVDDAWERLREDQPSTFDHFNQGEHPYQTQHLLERHLVVGEKLSISDLVSRHKISVIRGPHVTINQFVTRDMITVSNYGVTSKIVYGNIECTNGYIHLIDTVILKVILRENYVDNH